MAVPKMTNDSRAIQNYRIDKNTQWKSNRWGIQEPMQGNLIAENALDCIILPLIVFDQQGYRVGYGKGHYDRFLKKCKASAIKIGLCFEAPVKTIENVDAYDIPMDYCITPEKIFTFKHNYKIV